MVLKNPPVRKCALKDELLQLTRNTELARAVDVRSQQIEFPFL